MHHKDSSICVIPAPGWDPALPGKMLREVAGISLLARAVDTALASGVFGRVVVATDDRQVARAARGLGASLAVLPGALGRSGAGASVVVLGAVRTAGRYGWPADTVFAIAPEYPLLTPEVVRRAALRLSLGDVDSVTTVCHDRSWSANGPPEATVPEAPDLREVGAVLGTSAARLVETGHLLSGRRGYVVLPASRSIGIRCLEDLGRASRVLERVAAVERDAPDLARAVGR